MELSEGASFLFSSSLANVKLDSLRSPKLAALTSLSKVTTFWTVSRLVSFEGVRSLRIDVGVVMLS